jgi:CRISP-associated protein Cas1
MEPYRPYVDRLVYQILQEEALSSGEDATKTPLSAGEGAGGEAKNWGEAFILTPSLKRIFLQIPVMDVGIDGETRPLMVACQHTTASLSRCFDGEAKTVKYPVLQ